MSDVAWSESFLVNTPLQHETYIIGTEKILARCLLQQILNARLVSANCSMFVIITLRTKELSSKLQENATIECRSKLINLQVKSNLLWKVLVLN